MKKHLLIGLILSVSLLVGCQSPGDMIADKMADSANAKNEAVETVPQEPATYDEQFLITFAEAINGRQDNGARSALTEMDVLEIEKEAHDYYTTKTFKDPILAKYAANYLSALDEEIALVKSEYEPDYDEWKWKRWDVWTREVNIVYALIDEYDLQLKPEYIAGYTTEKSKCDCGFYSYDDQMWNNPPSPSDWYTMAVLSVEDASYEKIDDENYTVTLKVKSYTRYGLKDCQLDFFNVYGDREFIGSFEHFSYPPDEDSQTIVLKKCYGPFDNNTKYHLCIYSTLNMTTTKSFF